MRVCEYRSREAERFVETHGADEERQRLRKSDGVDVDLECQSYRDGEEEGENC